MSKVCIFDTQKCQIVHFLEQSVSVGGALMSFALLASDLTIAKMFPRKRERPSDYE